MDSADYKGKILFVDDEKNILRALNRIFLDSEMETIFCDSGSEALKIMEKEKEIDILVTDIRMPEMDGMILLGKVRDLYPTVSRIILSGFVEEKAVLLALNSGLASAYFAKPWDDKALLSQITQLFHIRKNLKDKKLLNLLGLIEDFPVFPAHFNEFVQAVEEDKNINEIARIIQKDVAAASRILRVANSAFYSGQRADNLNRAIIKIGLQSVRNIFLTLSVVNNLSWTATQVKYLEAVFEHSSRVNKFLELVYQVKFSQNLPLKYSSAGIIHDIGKIILLQYFKESFKEILDLQTQYPEMDFYECEVTLGFGGRTHAEIGAYFMNNWNFPQVLVEIALFHHNPQNGVEVDKEFMQIFKFTNKFVGYIENLNFRYDPDFSEFSEYGFTEQQLENLAKRIKKEMEESKT